MRCNLIYFKLQLMVEVSKKLVIPEIGPTFCENRSYPLDKLNQNKVQAKTISNQFIIFYINF